MSTVTAKSSPNYVIPGALALVSISMLVFGFIGETWWIGFGFVMLSTSVVLGVMAFGHATSMMEIPVVRSAAVRSAPRLQTLEDYGGYDRGPRRIAASE